MKKEWGIFPPNTPRASSGPCGSNQRSADAQGKVEGEVGTWGMGGAGKRVGKGGPERVRGKRAGIVGKAGRREERGKGDVRSPASGRHARTPDRKAPAPVPETMAWPEAPGSHDHPPPWESRVPEPEFRKNDGSGFRKNGLVQFRKNPKRGSGKTGPRAVPEKWPSSGKGVSSIKSPR